ncbi:MAG: hypothetical protein CVU22_00935 [Betaproteobacteria bacterium HGW-Betaproteobacteria-16]|nr:MAG: hypothetical protein CVU22_00935 [Betaproteobacteria bacterium HGW-Betaproteobacteria-16]
MRKSIQRVERTKHYDLAICCAYCGTKVVTAGDEDLAVHPCPHTLFVAHDEGFEYISPLAAEQLRQRGLTVEFGEDGFVQINANDGEVPGTDALTDSFSFPDAFKIAAYVAPPGGMGSYVGFAPNVDG